MPDLKIKYRPKSFKTFLGNEETISSLKTLLKKGKLQNSILITGPRGSGKTTLGRLIAKKELGCSVHDYKEMDSAVFNGIDTVRKIREELVYTPKKGDVKVYLIDEVHMLGVGGDSKKNKAQSALLKSLEEPPEYVYFILCTTNPEMVISTVRSRCTEFSLNGLDEPDTFALLKRICKKEKAEVGAKIFKKIYSISQGLPRDSISLLSKVIHLKTEKKMIKMLQAENLQENAVIKDLCQELMKGGDSGGDWDKVRKILKGLKDKKPEDIRRAVMGYANAVLLNGNPHGSYILGWFCYKPTYDAGWPIITQFCFNVTSRIEPPC